MTVKQMTFRILMKAMNDGLTLLSSNIIGVVPFSLHSHMACCLYLTSAQSTASSLRTLPVLKVQNPCVMMSAQASLEERSLYCDLATRPGTQ